VRAPPPARRRPLAAADADTRRLGAVFNDFKSRTEVQEHLFFALEPSAPYAARPGMPVPDAYRSTWSPLELLTAAAAWTEHVALGTGILVGGYHRPVELAQRLRDPSTHQQRLLRRRPWLVAGLFGLLHGCGFAGALREVGLPPGDVPLAFLSFNLGIEAGQLLLVAAVLALGAALKRLLELRPARLREPIAYGIGGLAGFWFIERLADFWA